MVTLVIDTKKLSGSSPSVYLDIIYGAPWGSILLPLLFNIGICDLFFQNYSSQFANFADNTISYDCGSTLNPSRPDPGRREKVFFTLLVVPQKVL